jgi:putative ATP-binding cassette transporter
VGKVRFAKLVAGLYVPGCGEIVLGHTRIDESCRQMYREHFTAVLDDVYLVRASLWCKEICDVKAGGEISEAVGIGQARRDPRQLLHEYNGSFLAVRKSAWRLFAAVMEDKTIYIFDEWAADQDAASEDIFMRHSCRSCGVGKSCDRVDA